MKFILMSLILIIFSLISCSISVVQTDINIEDTNLSYYIDEEWLSGNEIIIADRIVNYIRLSYPETPSSFPRFKIDKVELKNDAGREAQNNKLQKSLKVIMDRVVNELLPHNNISKTWNVKINISVRDPKLSNLETGLIIAYQFPAMALCWGSAFILCPVKDTEVFVIQLDIKTDKNKNIKIVGVGASTLYQQSIIIQDSNNGVITGTHERNTKALVAAVADTVEKLVKISMNPIPIPKH